jgi:signal transduction histidine kinase
MASRLLRFDPSAEAWRWLALYAAARLVATGFAAALVVWGGITGLELLLLLYGPLSTALLVASPRVRATPLAWTVDFAVTLACILASGDWRSPFYLLWLAALALPATRLSLRRALVFGAAATFAFLLAAIAGGPAPGSLAITSTETLAIHLSLPLLLVCSLAYAADALRHLARERSARERLAIETERRRIAWELHDSAKQRLHAAHLLVSAVQGHLPAQLEPAVARAAIELESAAADMDTSLAELRSPLEGRPLGEALRDRASELVPTNGPDIRVRGSAPPLPPLVGAHVYRIACEAMTNALRHADAHTIEVTIVPDERRLRIVIVDDGRGMPTERRSGATGLLGMEHRAATIGADLAIASGPDGLGTAVTIDMPINENGGRSWSE